MLAGVYALYGMTASKRHAGPTLETDLEVARALLRAEAQSVLAMADLLDDSFVRAVDLVVACAGGPGGGGSVLVAGLGKSGLIGQKVAATLSSLAITSHYVHPSEAAHGDLGRFRPSDLCIALSYSGETDEVVNLAAILRQDGIPIIAITRGSVGRTDERSIAAPSSLERLATVSLAVGDCDDADVTPAPMCSTTAMLALGDALALCASRQRNLTDDEFARRHPGGSLGGMLRPVMDIVRFRVGDPAAGFIAAVPDDLTVAAALQCAEQTNGRRPGALLLVDSESGRLSGLFTDGDLRRLVLRGVQDLSRPVRELMTRDPATLPHTALARDAVRMVQENRRDEIPIVDERHRPVGILDVQDLIAMRLVRDERSTVAGPGVSML